MYVYIHMHTNIYRKIEKQSQPLCVTVFIVNNLKSFKETLYIKWYDVW